MAKWDIYARTNPFNYAILSSDIDDDSPRSMFQQSRELPLFKTDNIEDYKRYRSMLQVIDMTLLDLDSF